MGVWDWISSSTDYVKQYTPDVTPVTKTCRGVTKACWGATTQVGTVVTTKAREIHEYASDDQVRTNFTRIATNISKNGALYLVRFYGGGPVIDVVGRSLQDGKLDSQKGRIQELETRIAKLEKELLNAVKTPEQVQKSKAQNEPNLNQRPEDVLHMFMMKQFIGTKLLDDLIVPGTTGSRKKEMP